MTARTLVLLRHAKAEHTAGVPDADRRLTARGRADAAAAGTWLAHHGVAPDLVLCSPSQRTRETWLAVQKALGHKSTVVYEPQVYDEGARALLELIRATEPGVQTLLVIGHNPTVSMVSTMLDPDTADDDGLKTGGLAVHRLTGSWSDCGPSEAPLTAVHTARG
jgi:phosphohistidine phosphatase